MGTTRRLLVGGAALVLALMAAACGPKQEKIKLGFLVKMPEESWFQNEWKFAQQCADRYGFQVVKLGTKDGAQVLSAIDNLGAQGAQGFVICTPEPKLGPAILQRARANDLKVFAVDDQFVGEDGKFMDVPYMGISASEIGHKVGQALYDEFKRRGWKPEETAACAVNFDELNTVKERTDGATDQLVKCGFPAARIYRTAERTTNEEASRNATDTLLTQHPEVKRWLVFSVNDEGVLGAVRALEGRGFNADTVIGVGIGGSSALPEFRKQKPTGFFATCLISPKRHGYETTEYLYKWVKDGIAPPKDTRTAGMIVTRGDCEKVMKEQGLL